MDLEKMIKDNPPGEGEAAYVVELPDTIPDIDDWLTSLQAKVNAGWKCSGCGSPGGYICVCG